MKPHQVVGFSPELKSGVNSTKGVAIERSPIVELLGAGRSLDGVRLRDGRIVRVDAIFTGPRSVQASPIAESLGCAFEDGPLGPYVWIDARNETTVPGVFAAGDMALPMANATLASASGVMAGSGAYQSLMLADMEQKLAAV